MAETSPDASPEASSETSSTVLPAIESLEDLEGLEPEDLEAIAERLSAQQRDPIPEISQPAPPPSETPATTEARTTDARTADARALDLDAAERKAEAAAQLYLEGRAAFESGYYRQAIAQLEKAAALSVKTSPIGGEIQIWLVSAYQAHDDLDAAQALCRQLTRHPNIDTRQKSRRLLAILEAPRLAMRPEWLSEIPDLSKIEDSEDSDKKGSGGTYKPRPIRKLEEPEIDPSTIVRDDNQFIWVAIAFILAMLLLLARMA